MRVNKVLTFITSFLVCCGAMPTLSDSIDNPLISSADVITISSSRFGDVNNDGSVNSIDLAYITRYLSGTDTLNDEQFICADTNASGVITEEDANIIKYMYLGTETSYVQQCKNSWINKYVGTTVDSGSCGSNVTYSFNGYNGTLTISGSGSMQNNDSKYNMPWYDYKESIKKVVINSGVTIIGRYSFEYCTNLTTIIIPSSVVAINLHAFNYCPSLNNIIVDTNNSYYSSTNGILFNKDKTAIIQYPIGNVEISYNIPTSVKSIDTYAFYNCTNLESITMSNNLTFIDFGAFYNCTNLKTISISSSVESIKEYAFENCSSLKDVYYNGTKSQWDNIEISDYNECLNNATIHYSNGVGGMCGDNVTWFFNEVTDTLTISGTGDMQQYSSIQNVPWHSYKSSIKKVIIENGVTSIGQSAFDSCSYLTSVTISNSVTSIGPWAFSGCESLGSIVIPNSVTSIEGYAFGDCTSLSIITLSNNLESIYSEVFYNCTSLKSITIPKSVTSILYYAFDGCTALTDIYYEGSKSDWDNIDIRVGNSNLDDMTIHYLLQDIILGDINSDNSINGKDLMLLKRYILGVVTQDSINFDNSDVNKDTKVNGMDLIILKKYILGSLSTLE